MKLNLALVAAVAAQWNGQSEDAPCGMQVVSGDSLVNSTCTISGSNIKAIYAGNGAFIKGLNQLTGFDGISGDLDAIVLFDQSCDETGCDNSTCWDASYSCVDNGAAASEVMFMETVNSVGQNGGVINLQIANVGASDTVTITLNDGSGNPVKLANITSAGGAVSADSANDGTFAVTANENFGDLLQVSVNVMDGLVNLFKSQVTSV